MNLLPQMGAKNLNERNLQRGDFSVHENAGQIELHLKSYVDICAIDCWRPPKSETTIRNLIQTRSLRIGQFFELEKKINSQKHEMKQHIISPSSVPQSLTLFPKTNLPKL
jgi:hypothetical protein